MKKNIVLIFTFVLLLAGSAWANPACSSSECNPASAHNILSLNMNSTRTPENAHTFTNVSPGAIQGYVSQYCRELENYANTYQDPTSVVEYYKCDLYPKSVYGQYVTAAIGASSTKKATGITTTGPVSISQLNAVMSCDARSTLFPNGAGSFACYCPPATEWFPSLGKCVSVVENIVGGSASGTPRSGSCSKPDPAVGHPIYPMSGAKKLEADTGWIIGRQSWIINFSSLSKIPYSNAGTEINGSVTPSIGQSAPAFGTLWYSSLHKTLQLKPYYINGVGYAIKNLVASRGFGAGVQFERPNSLTYTAPPDVLDKMEPVGNLIRYTDAQGNIETYDTYGASSVSTQADLISVSYSRGGTLAYTYSNSATPFLIAPAARLLIKVQDNLGRAIQFRYQQPNPALPPRIYQATGPDQRVMTFAYDENNSLKTINWPDGQSRHYLYERADLPWAVTGEIDENGSRLSTYGYDLQGRAIDTQYAGGVSRYSTAYATPPSWVVAESMGGTDTLPVLTRTHTYQIPQGVSLSSPSGSASSMGVASVQGKAYFSGQSQPAGSGCAASSENMAYDANGNILLHDNFQGERTCSVYDTARNLETSRVEGLSNSVACSSVTANGAAVPAGARKITTQWHPDWRLPVKVYGPEKLTHYIYQGQPDAFNGNSAANCTPAPALPNGKPTPAVCKQVEQATTDATGKLGSSAAIDTSVAQRNSEFTYNASGRMLTNTDALARTTRYAYYGSTAFSGQAPIGGDANFDHVTLLLHGDGSDQSTVFPDASASRKTLSVGGGVKTSVAQSKFGGSSIVFDGSRDYLTLPFTPDLNMGANNFTIEMWIYKVANNPNGSILLGVEGDSKSGVKIGFDPSGNILTSAWTDPAYDAWYPGAGPAIANGAWKHIALVRSGGTVTRYVDGVGTVLVANLAAIPLVDAHTNQVVGGQGFAIDRGFNGYIDDLRITKGVARYTANFTPPTQALPNVGEVLDPAAVGYRTGDLQSITNAAGHITSFNQYDQAGRVRQMTDAKGVVTDTTYTPRGWIASTTVTPPGGVARTTTYTYDNAGQLTGVTLPDAASLSYSYDAAHRLVGVTDAKGNSVTYTLDNMGNRVGEQVKDVQGTLQRSITRVYDALNRVQQITGAAN
ncbi:MAG: LamG-like jellyroll fold domain-containing protein [Polaromonas sp.]|nr:LamG-like jellyroll fold domain-containing protein [Polaromonas sp.]MDP3752141.1 LamG-like jellyroll fold domain-containing protein [Polaromonas sp.]